MIVLKSPVARHTRMRSGVVSVTWPRYRTALATLAFATLTAACGGASRDDSGRTRSAAEPASVEQRRAVVEKEGVVNPPQRAPSTESSAATQTGEVPPQLLALLRDDLARRALVKPETITVVSATEQQWPNGAMGCPQPGQIYTQAIVAGYRVVLQTSGEKYAYHTDQRGHFIVCSSGLSFAPVKEQMKTPRATE